MSQWQLYYRELSHEPWKNYLANQRIIIYFLMREVNFTGHFGSQVISASDGTDVSKADNKFSKTIFACQVLSNWKLLLTCPRRCSSAFAAPLTMLSPGVLVTQLLLKRCRPSDAFLSLPEWTGFVYLHYCKVTHHVHVQRVANLFFPRTEGEHLRFFVEKSLLIPPAVFVNSRTQMKTTALQTQRKRPQHQNKSRVHWKKSQYSWSV